MRTKRRSTQQSKVVKVIENVGMKEYRQRMSTTVVLGYVDMIVLEWVQVWRYIEYKWGRAVGAARLDGWISLSRKLCSSLCRE